MAKEIVDSGKFQRCGKVTFAIFDEDIAIDTSLFPSLLPDAQVIMIASRLKANPKRWGVDLRLGNKIQAGLLLDKRVISAKLDPNYGGRWNAGSNRRPADGIKEHGGTDMDPTVYAIKLDEILNSYKH